MREIIFVPCNSCVSHDLNEEIDLKLYSSEYQSVPRKLAHELLAILQLHCNPIPNFESTTVPDLLACREISHASINVPQLV